MERELTEQEWREIGAKLAEPFDPEDVEFRAQSAGKAEEAGGRQRVLAYMDARLVQDRLDAVVGPGAWSFRYEPLLIGGGEVQLAKGILTIYGVTKEDIGDASSFSPSKGCVSDALKRAAFMWGIGRYLYDVEKVWVQVEKGGKIPDATLRSLRAKLPRPGGAPVTRTPAQAEYKERQPEEEQGAPAAAPADLPPVGDTKFWNAIVDAPNQLEIVALLRQKGYTTQEGVVIYFNQLAEVDNFTVNDIAQLAGGAAKWLTRRLYNDAKADLKKRKDAVKKGA